MFKRVITGLGALLLLTAPFSSAQAALLARVEADVDGSGQKKNRGADRRQKDARQQLLFQFVDHGEEC